MNSKLLLKAVLIIVPAGVFVTSATALTFAAMRGDDAPIHSTANTTQISTSDAPQSDAQSPSTRPASDSYPIDVCPVSGEKLGSMGEPVVKEIDGRTVKFCCAGCVPAFERESEKYHAKMDELIIAAQGEDYPLDRCLVTNEKIGGMGEPVQYVHRPSNTLVKFCCGMCKSAFAKNPDQYLAKLTAARAAE